MTSVHAVVTALLAAGSSTTTKNTANPIVSLLPLILIFGVAYVFFLRPRSQAARRQRDTLMELSAGDEVLTGAGIFGTVLDVEDDRVTLETAPGTRITVLRSTIARKLNNPIGDEPSWDEHDEDEAHGAYEDYEHDHDHPDGEAEDTQHPAELAEHNDEDDEHDEHDADDEDDEHHEGAAAHDPDEPEAPGTVGEDKKK